MSGKEMWIQAYDELVEKYLEEGFSENAASARAEEEASTHAYEKMAGQADYLRMISKEKARQ